MSELDQAAGRRIVERLTAAKPWERNNETVFCTLMLVGGHDVPREAVDNWTDAEAQEAQDWALREHLSASDNDDVERMSMPLHVQAYPRKPREGAGDLWDN